MLKETGRGKYRFEIRDLVADVRCSQAVLDFLSAADVGRRIPAPAEEDAQSEALECGRRERQDREDAEEVCAGGEEQPLFLSRLPWRRRRREPGGRLLLFFSFAFPLPFSFVNSLVRSIAFGAVLGEGGRSKVEVRTVARNRIVLLSPRSVLVVRD